MRVPLIGVAAVGMLFVTLPAESSPHRAGQDRDAHAQRASTPHHAPKATAPPKTVTLVAAGDLCGDCARTARRAREQRPDVVVTMGDLAYNHGLLSEFRRNYAGGTKPRSRWGARALKSITLPGYGNHDCYDVPLDTGAVKQGCSDAVTFFGRDRTFGKDIAGTPGSYSTVVGNWLIVHLNSAGQVGSGRATPSEMRQQRVALRKILVADKHACEMVVWHHPRYSSGEHGSNAFVDPWYETAYFRGVDVILNGHDHDYERFTRQNGNGRWKADGVQQFVVGTGGAEPRSFDDRVRNSVVRIADNGILTMELKAKAYSYEFLDDVTSAVDDSGARRCHR
jgi:hypothetical protein